MRFRPDLAAWDPWHPRVVAERLVGVDLPWYVAAGWAVDLFVGRQTRDHEDLEIGIPADGFDHVAARFPDCEFFAIVDGHAVPSSAAPAHVHQTWARERATGKWRLDVFREPGDGDTWICRRDTAIRMPYEELIARTREGIPYCQPEVALLFKAKNPRPKDGADLARVLPMLGLQQRAWLREALTKVHPGHPWLNELA